MMRDAQWKRSCATCRHRTALGKRKPPNCTGCVKGGEMTRWEAVRLAAGTTHVHYDSAPMTETGEQAALIHKSTA